jgi:hypothetical protein
MTAMAGAFNTRSEIAPQLVARDLAGVAERAPRAREPADARLVLDGGLGVSVGYLPGDPVSLDLVRVGRVADGQCRLQDTGTSGEPTVVVQLRSPDAGERCAWQAALAR